MNQKDARRRFSPSQIDIVQDAVAVAEELVSNYYKMSASEWRRLNYDVTTFARLDGREIIDGPFAQIVRYEARPQNADLGSSAYDFYKICLQDHAILDALHNAPELKLFPFSLYIISHELVHVVRFCKFLQNFEATEDEKLIEETRVHRETHDILMPVRTDGIDSVLNYYGKWREPFDASRTMPFQFR